VYTIQFTDEGLQDVKALPKHVMNSLKKEMAEKVQRDPVGCAEPLQGVLAGWYSFHYLEYRVIYKVYEDLSAVGVVAVGRHDPDLTADIYRRLEAAVHTGKLAESVLATLRGFTDR
jgi:mRNA-degrading endonuclease RelE of RelBE toxin-antitoxin system